MNDTDRARAEARWRALYGAAVDGDYGIECDTCGALLLGDEPSITIICLECFLAEAEDVSLNNKSKAWWEAEYLRALDPNKDERPVEGHEDFETHREEWVDGMMYRRDK